MRMTLATFLAMAMACGCNNTQDLGSDSVMGMGGQAGGSAGGAGGNAGASGGSAGEPPVEVIYYNNFEQNTSGSDAYRESWSYCQTNPGVAIVQDGADTNPSRVFRAQFPKETWGLTSDVGFRCRYDFRQGRDEVYLSYRIKLGEGFDPVKGGYLPRVEAGEAGSPSACPDGTDFFTGGMMFRNEAGTSPSFFIYHPDQWNAPWYRNAYHNVTGSYPTSCADYFSNEAVFAELHGVSGTSFPWMDPCYSCVWNSEGCFVGKPVTIVAGEWHTVTERIVANAVGKQNGIAEGYLDGVMVSQVTGLRFRDVDTLKLNWIDFVGFFSGDDASWATTKDETILFDDVIAYHYSASSGQPVGNVLRDPNGVLPAVAYPAQSVLSDSN